MITTNALITSISASPSGAVVIIDCQVADLFSFAEGQFMMLQTLIGDKLIKRAYSIYSTNKQLQDTQTISFCIKRVEGGLFSTRATQIAKIGMKITLTGPVGKFVDTGVSRNYLFVSVGSGLSPCFSIYQHLLQTGGYDKIVNLFGERYLDHIPKQVLEQYSIQNAKIKNMIFLSKQEESNKYKVDNLNVGDPSTPLSLHHSTSSGVEAGGRKEGYVQDGLDEALEFLHGEKSPLTPFIKGEFIQKGVIIFICGLPAMCDDVAARLLEKGFEKSQLIIEKY